MKLRIVAINGSHIVGGGEIAPAKLLAALEHRGHTVMMLCGNRDVARQIKEMLGIPTDFLLVGGLIDLYSVMRLALWLRRWKPDAVILTTFKKLAQTSLACRLAGVPYVLQRVGLESDVPRRFTYKIGLRHWVDAIVLNADAMRRAFIARDDRLDQSKVITILDGVASPPTQATGSELRAELGIPRQARVIGTVTRLTKQKRIDRMLEAVTKLPEDVHCIIAGDGELRAVLEALSKERGLTERVHFLGFRKDIGQILEALDIFVVSSDREGLANAMLEAMHRGVPIVSTDVSGAREALTGDSEFTSAGLIVPHEVDALAGAIERLLDDSELRNTMSIAARSRATSMFSEAHFTDQWEELLLRSHSRPAPHSPT